MTEIQAKYHHLIPQTYISAWANASGTLNVRYLETPSKVVRRNKERLAGIYDFYTIRAGMTCCSEMDLKSIFLPLRNLTVKYDNKIVKDPSTLNQLYYDFDNWIITRADGSCVSKKKIKHQIDQVKIKDIEANFSKKYENQWRGEVEKIKRFICELDGYAIKEFDKDYLNKFFTLLDWRGFSSSAYFEEALQESYIHQFAKIEIPKRERMLTHLDTAFDEVRHCLLLKYYRDFLNNSGVIYNESTVSLNHVCFILLVADGCQSFITSDSPAFYHELGNGKRVGLLPITPKILMLKDISVYANRPYYILHISDNCVEYYNSIIYKNATQFGIEF